MEAKRVEGCWGDDPEIQAICELYNRPAEIWAYDSAQGAKKLRTFHEPAGLQARQPMRLSFYGGGHYDSISDPRGIPSGSLLLTAPGQYEDDSLKRMRLMNERSVAGYSSAMCASDTEETERLSLEAALRVSRNDIQSKDDDLERCLSASLVEFNSNTPANFSSQIELDLIQDELVRSIAAQSEREYIEEVLQNSVSTVKDIVPSACTGESKVDDNDDDLAHAIRLSNLSEQEAFERALRESIEDSQPNYNHISDSFGLGYDDDDEAILQAIISESLASSSNSLPQRK